ncbi:MAG: HAMP domain-containing histidine kinase [Deltaproteobacteria bacterium]|nr:HAMP domain-containing histidine kinase [Deltaproteobacteria bacterium]MBW1932217.1 HAMP domain-containing histidine kinase [Deltaproteobacteria bacterium]MBW2080269.1 HAMP domain-containing histidine kinase [Deltaproteobacteria bacterium]
MSYQWDILGEEGLQFFGKMSASISHEMKNVLAVVNENAGLLQDFIYMNERGTPIDPEQLKGVSQMIKKQVQRADGIMKNMNKFAHSTDQLIKTESVNNILDIVTSLAIRFASMREITLEKIPSDEQIEIETNPFLLENLIWLCIDLAMDAVGPERTVRLLAKKIDNGVQIIFSQLGSMPVMSPETFPGKRMEALLSALQGDITVDSQAGTISISLPV